MTRHNRTLNYVLFNMVMVEDLAQESASDLKMYTFLIYLN